MGNSMTLYIPTVLGDLALELEGQKLLSLEICNKRVTKKQLAALDSEADSQLTGKVLEQLKGYFSSATSFKKISLDLQGTPFQKSVWRELRKIPLGETRTYGEIASKLNSSARAVGNACRRNPIPIIVPCHRVISANGLGGYAGETEGEQLNIKRWLLKHEGALQ